MAVESQRDRVAPDPAGIKSCVSRVFASLRGRLLVLLMLVAAAAVAAGILMFALFRQSATARAGQAEAEIGRGCDAIAGGLSILQRRVARAVVGRRYRGVAP